ncbi:hypothetical protein EXIGLDRAFT_686667 [Exidia glandulosa HHB12029]|uniref:FHA domain-containing protein n=1 Tax=Exidia glandulosa HHB12029 TaxID=1314781 RepID=A0A165BMN5_EXIGL|nr:hypothetical protein EXIGLDRAFT_686667 [Exidia glandulosa HHB12029]
MSTFTSSTATYPALSLFPLNETFQPKNIILTQRAKIGRQSNAKTIPTERNGYFDTKVISRQHAEVWFEDGKVWIKDVKSSNGTYINTQRLAPEGVESEPFELHTGDILELGTDIASDDNTKIVHHKVAARVTCILTADDAAVHRQQHDPQASQYAFGQGAPPAARRPMNGMGMSMGGLGGSTRAPGTRSFDHIMSKIQQELLKSRETAQDLQGLTGAMNDIQDTLGGTLPVVPSQQPRLPSTNGPALPLPSAPPPADLVALQSQLSETQSWIAGQVDKFKSLALDNVANELTALRRDVDVLRELMQAQRAAQDEVARSAGAVSPVARVLAREEAEASADDDDDARSVATEIPDREHDFVEDESKWADNVRPGTPEPVENGDKDASWDLDTSPQHSSSSQLTTGEHDGPQPLSPGKPGRARLQPKREKERDEETARQLESVMSLARELERQHAEANETIRALQDKVLELEARESVRGLEEQVRALEERHTAHEARTSSVQEALEGVRVEWAGVREDWASERARIAKAVDDFEAAKVLAVDEISKARAPPSPPKSVDADSADSGEASGDLGEEEEGQSRVLPLPSPKRKKNRRRKSSSIRRDESSQETDPRDEDWERHALLTPSSMSSGSSGARRMVNGRVNGVVSSDTRDSIASSLDSLTGDGELDNQTSAKDAGAAGAQRPAALANQNFTPIAGTLALCVVVLAVAYGRDLRLIT